MTYRKLWSEMADVVGRRPPITTTPEWINWTAGRVGDLAGKLMGKEPIVNSASTAMGSLYHWYSSEKAERELGYQSGPVKEALQDAWEWFQQHGYVR